MPSFANNIVSCSYLFFNVIILCRLQQFISFAFLSYYSAYNSEMRVCLKHPDVVSFFFECSRSTVKLPVCHREVLISHSIIAWSNIDRPFSCLVSQDNRTVSVSRKVIYRIKIFIYLWLIWNIALITKLAIFLF